MLRGWMIRLMMKLAGRRRRATWRYQLLESLIDGRLLTWQELCRIHKQKFPKSSWHASLLAQQLVDEGLIERLDKPYATLYRLSVVGRFKVYSLRRNNHLVEARRAEAERARTKK